jgi:hypothetical protein
MPMSRLGRKNYFAVARMPRHFFFQEGEWPTSQRWKQSLRHLCEQQWQHDLMRRLSSRTSIVPADCPNARIRNSKVHKSKHIVEQIAGRSRYDHMTTFIIDPEIRLRHRQHPILRTIDEAAEFARRMAAGCRDTTWAGVSHLLERIRTEDDAVEAAVALEMLLEREGMLVSNNQVPALAAQAASASGSDSARATSMIFEAAVAEPSAK